MIIRIPIHSWSSAGQSSMVFRDTCRRLNVHSLLAFLRNDRLFSDQWHPCMRRMAMIPSESVGRGEGGGGAFFIESPTISWATIWIQLHGTGREKSVQYKYQEDTETWPSIEALVETLKGMVWRDCKNVYRTVNLYRNILYVQEKNYYLVTRESSNWESQKLVFLCDCWTLKE